MLLKSILIGMVTALTAGASGAAVVRGLNSVSCEIGYGDSISAAECSSPYASARVVTGPLALGVDLSVVDGLSVETGNFVASGAWLDAATAHPGDPSLIGQRGYFRIVTAMHGSIMRGVLDHSVSYDENTSDGFNFRNARVTIVGSIPAGLRPYDSWFRGFGVFGSDEEVDIDLLLEYELEVIFGTEFSYGIWLNTVNRDAMNAYTTRSSETLVNFSHTAQIVGAKLFNKDGHEINGSVNTASGLDLRAIDQQIPEPATYALALGAVGVALLVRRRRTGREPIPALLAGA